MLAFSANAQIYIDILQLGTMKYCVIKQFNFFKASSAIILHSIKQKKAYNMYFKVINTEDSKH